MNWIKFYIASVILSLAFFAYFLIRFIHLSNRIHLYLRDNHTQFFLSQKLQAFGSFEEFIKLPSLPLKEFERQTRLIFSKTIIFDETLSVLQRSMKNNFYLTLSFFILFILLGFSGKLIINWAGS